MSSPRWTDAFLDELRHRGDGPADEAMAKLFADHQVERAQEILDHLVHNDDRPAGSLPAQLAKYLAQVESTPIPHLTEVERGERIFAQYGPEILLVLACYTLPAGYATEVGVKVLYRSGYLADRPNRRLYETLQMVMDVMSPGGLGPEGDGVRTAEKVRLIHAAIRHLILADRQDPWDLAWGLPINQEDMAGNLMALTVTIMDGLEKLGLDVEPEDQEAYLQAWCAVGRLLGIVPELIPDNMSEARELTDIIQRRQVAPCQEGRLMTRALLDMLEDNIPGERFDGFGASLMRHFLPQDVADGLEIPHHALCDRIIPVVAAITGVLDHTLHRPEDQLQAYRKFSLHIMEFVVGVERGNARAGFQIPTHLHEHWGIVGPEELTFWDQLRKRGADYWERTVRTRLGRR